MHLQVYPPLQHPPKRAQQGEILRTSAVGNRGNMGGGTRCPFSVLSSNTSHRHGNGPTQHSGGGGGGVAGTHGLNCRSGNDKPSYSLPPPSAPTPPCCHDDQEEAWSVVRPGHVREKIAMFASSCGAPQVSEDLEEALSLMGGGLKMKGGWEGEGRSAKRPRRSGGGGGEEQEGEEAVSVGEMVAFLEQRASEQQMTSVPLLSLQRSSASITLSRTPPRPATRAGSGSEVSVEGSEVSVEGSEVSVEGSEVSVEGSEISVEAVRVWDLVARLESECVKSRSGPGRRLLRGVGRVLLAVPQSSSSSPSSLVSSSSSSSSSSLSSAPQPSLPPAVFGGGSGSESLAQLEAGDLGQTEVQRPRGSHQDPAEPRTPSCEEEEEVEEEAPPGKLFFSQSLVQNSQHSYSSSKPSGEPADGARQPSQAPPPTSLLLLLSSPDSSRAPELEVRRCGPRGGEPEAKRPGASHDFLEARFKLQLLLEPQSSLLLLPPHLLLYILSLLPTHALAALKCCCRHFSSLIDVYGVRPADSRWVGDPRYRDDPCKQCKRRYRRGDVSLCRWHHKPYCQALPYGPGYWMCCHGGRKDSPGCNVGLHDNRWVPDFHSFTSPIYRRRREEPEE